MKVCMHNLPTLVYYTTERNPASASIQPQQGHLHGARQETQNGLHGGCFEAEVGFWYMIWLTLGRLMFMPSLVSFGWAASDLEAELWFAENWVSNWGFPLCVCTQATITCTLSCLINEHVRLFFLRNEVALFDLIRHIFAYEFSTLEWYPTQIWINLDIFLDLKLFENRLITFISAWHDRPRSEQISGTPPNVGSPYKWTFPPLTRALLCRYCLGCLIFILHSNKPHNFFLTGITRRDPCIRCVLATILLPV